MRPGRGSLLQRAAAMFVERVRFSGGRILVVAFLLSRLPAERPVRNGTFSSQDGLVAGGRHIVRDDKRQPQQIIGEARAHAATRRRMPPVQHIPGFELVPRGLQDVLAGEVRRGVDQRHHVLQLIAKAERAAGLIERRAPPHPARKRLVEQPAVQQEIHRRIRRLHLDRPQQLVPERHSPASRPPRPAAAS